MLPLQASNHCSQCVAGRSHPPWTSSPTETSAGTSLHISLVGLRTMPIDLPLPLRSALEAGTCTLFIGAGIGHYAVDADGNPAPDGPTLAQELADHFGISIGAQRELSKVAQLVVARRGRDELDSFLTKRLAQLEPDESLVWLLQRTWKAIFTTNFDHLIERAYERMAAPTQSPVAISSSADVVPIDPRFEVPIYHLHGSLFDGQRTFALITDSDYALFREHRAMLFEVLKISYATSPILYIGYSNSDPNWNTVIGGLLADFSPGQPPDSWRVAPDTSELDAEVLRTQGVHTLDGTLGDFVTAYQASLGDLRVDPTSLAELERSVPTDLLSVFAQQPAALVRLLNSWTYVNQEDFTSAPNVNAYLLGDRPTWPLIAQGIPFERDVEEEVLEHLLDYATSPERTIKTLAILAPAGYGTTTVLMSLATRLLKERAGYVLYHRPGSSVLEGDVEFAVRFLPSPLFIFIDNAADAAEALRAVVSTLRTDAASVCFVLGERLNEWRQRRIRLSPREFGIEPLSTDEAERLLQCLSDNGSLGVLRDLPHSLQLAAITQRHKSELLVAMREATEGKAFGAIIEDEYWGLGSDLARQIYGAVSSLYRLRAYPRDGLIASIIGCNLMDLYGDVRNSLEGVVIYDTVDEAQGITVARARHHVIADLVWDRCLNAGDKEGTLLAAVRALNLNYSQDSKAFDSLFRADDAIDAISSLESRIDFFEAACRKDPFSPYVRQHYARMLRRARKFELALEQIKAALALRPSLRSLHHTMGVILADMVFESESREIGRRRMAQAEGAFQKVLAMNPRDEYGHQGLAQLYLDWARESSSEEETAEYLRRCEDAISKGMREVSDREGLWIVSSNAASFLDDSPKVVAALERAIKENPGASVARYLLGRSYFEQGDYDNVIATLKPRLEVAPDDYRSALLYAQALHVKGASYSEALAVLRLGDPTGGRDARFVATLGGMLFMSGAFAEAKDVFARARDRAFTFEASNRVEFVPRASGTPLRLTGTVQRMHAGYTFIRVPGFPDFFCPGGSFGAIRMREGLPVQFSPGFAVRGAMAIDLAEITLE